MPSPLPNGTTNIRTLALVGPAASGKTSLAAPEMIRAPLRGMISRGKDLMGVGKEPAAPVQTTPEDVEAVAGVAGSPLSPKSVASGTGKAVAAARAPKKLPEQPSAERDKGQEHPRIGELHGQAHGQKAGRAQSGARACGRGVLLPLRRHGIDEGP